jgi:hypothetical protein
MRAPLSIIIPTLNAGDGFALTLGALGPGLEAGLIREVVISDGGSQDATHAIADSAGAVWLSGPAGRGGQLARGAAQAGGQWLLFLHADTYLGEDWPHAVLAHMRNHPDKAGYFRLAFRAEGILARLVAGWANLRSRRLNLPYGDQGLLIHRDLYERIGGFADIPLMEDVAIAQALKGHLVAIEATAFTSAERYEAQGWLRRGARNLVTLTRYLCGARPETLTKAYEKR